MILHAAVSDAYPEMRNGLTLETAFPDIQSAYDAAVNAHKLGKTEGKTTILVHKGDYRLKKPLRFYSDLPVEIRPFEQDMVTISGGTPLLQGWKKVKINDKTAWKVVLPDSITSVPFLFLNGKLAGAARWPKKDYLRVVGVKDGFITTDADCDNFQIRKGDFNPKWHDPENISIKMIHKWIEETLTFKSYDEENCRITTGSGIRYICDERNTEFAFYNVREALSEPGEYYFDRISHELFLIAEKADFEAVIPSCGTLIRFEPGARWITLTGLHFRYAGTHWPLSQKFLDLRDPGFSPVWNSTAGTLAGPQDTFQVKSKKDSLPCYSGGQGAVHVPGVILFRRASDCTIQDCEINACAWYAVQALEGCGNLVFRNNSIHDMGAGGFLAGGGNADTVKTDSSSLTHRIIIRDNHIHDCGKFFYSAIGVILTHACGCVVEGNHIHDLYYSGISCGWVWGYGDSVSKENSICRNHIHDLGKGILSDMGGIYLLGIQPGTRVCENVIHDIVNRYYGGWGLYTDEGSSHIVLEKNVVYDCACQGFHQHYGRENIVRYNVFAFNKRHGIAATSNWLRNPQWPGESHSKCFNLLNNVIITEGTPAYKTCGKELLEKVRILSDNNFFYECAGKQKIFAWEEERNKSFSLSEWQKTGLDKHSVFQKDLGFRNMKKRDFRLKKDSILREYGFDFLDDLLK